MRISPTLNEWLNLVIRWFHVFTGILWIGTTYYFTWLDGRFAEAEQEAVRAGGDEQARAAVVDRPAVRGDEATVVAVDAERMVAGRDGAVAVGERVDVARLHHDGFREIDEVGRGGVPGLRRDRGLALRGVGRHLDATARSGGSPNRSRVAY